MTTYDENPYSVHFAHFASRLEEHLRKNGIPCDDADRIIEESSVIYFDRLSSANKFAKLFRKQDPANVFVDSAFRAIVHHLPEAKGTFGSPNEIERAIR